MSLSSVLKRQQEQSIMYIQIILNPILLVGLLIVSLFVCDVDLYKINFVSALLTIPLLFLFFFRFFHVIVCIKKSGLMLLTFE
jgi:hypothetical protein